MPHEIIYGIEGNISKIKQCLEQMNIIGIVGMGGIGKSTLAKAIYDEIKSTYDASCFVGPLKNSDCLDILLEILPKLGIGQKIDNLEHAQKFMKELFDAKKILLILDNIKDQVQVDNIVPKSILCAANRCTVIVTTRDRSAIKNHVDGTGIVEVDTLDENAAMKLFTTHIFGAEGNLPIQFHDIGGTIVKACNGLPLSLKVVGAFLRNKNLRLRIWERVLQRMKRGRCFDGHNEASDDMKLWSTLRISFDELKDEEKNMFLDIACFFCRDVCLDGISKGRALRVWNEGGIPPLHTFNILVDQSLVKVDKENELLEMHDQLRDMGRMIAEKEEQYQGTRMWNTSLIPSKFTDKVLFHWKARFL
jgi:dephospho-CoA kinase